MNDKLIIEKLKELIKMYQGKADIQHEVFQSCADFIDLFDDKIDHDSPEVQMLVNKINDLKDRNNKIAKELESELSLLEQNKGKETKETVVSAEETINKWIETVNYQIDTLESGYADVTVFSVDKDLFLKIMTEALEKRDHSASPTMSKPSDKDIENAALDYVDEESNHFARQAKRTAYISGAKDVRDNNIYISPNSKSE